MDIVITDMVSLRDLVLVVWGIVGTIAAIVLIVVAIKLDRKLGSIFGSVMNITETVKNTVALISEMIIEPISSIYSWAKGGYEGFSIIAKLLQDRGKEKDE